MDIRWESDESQMDVAYNMGGRCAPCEVGHHRRRASSLALWGAILLLGHGPIMITWALGCNPLVGSWPHHDYMGSGVQSS